MSAVLATEATANQVTGKLDVRELAARLPEEIEPMGDILEEDAGMEEVDDAAEEAA